MNTPGTHAEHTSVAHYIYHSHYLGRLDRSRRWGYVDVMEHHDHRKIVDLLVDEFPLSLFDLD